MLIHGVANPRGESDSYNGLYYKQEELQDLAKNGMRGTMVKAEHTGESIGQVISGFVGEDGALHCVMQVDEKSVEGAIAAGLIRDGIAAELSLGYAVDIRHSDNKMQAEQKTLLEISIVRQGARQGCYIYAYEDKNDTVKLREDSRDDTWDCFEM